MNFTNSPQNKMGTFMTREINKNARTEHDYHNEYQYHYYVF